MSEESQILEPPAKKLKACDRLEENNVALEHDFSQDINMSEAGNGLPVSSDNYDNFVTPEELDKLREFQVLDEVKSNDEDSNDDASDSSDGKSEDVPEEELEKMLDEDLPEDFKGVPKPKEKAYITRQKVVLEEKGINHFEVLPLDWMMARHYSGMPIYMHRTTRVCTLSKPYFLGKGNTRRHDIPISAIPCLSYRRALEEEDKQKEIDKQIQEQIKNGTWQRNTDKPQVQSHDMNGQASEKEKTDSTTLAQKKKSKCPFKHGRLIVQNIEAVGNKNVAIAQNISENNVDAIPKAEVDNEIVLPHDNTQIDKESATADTPNTKPSNPINETTEIVTTNENNQATNTNNSDTNSVEGTASEVDKTNTNPAVKKIPLNRQPVVLPGGIVMPPPRVETVSTSWKTQHLTHEQVNEYCKKLFKFKTVNIMHFKRWADRRKYTKARKTLQYPTLPEGTKLITIPAQPATGQENGGGKANKRDWVMNMNGRSYLSVFHEYVRRALQKQPVYEFKQLENAATPYQATVYIGGMQYGVGHGSSKRSAKSAAARSSIHILIPEMGAELESAPPNAASSEPDFSFFDYVGIEDPRITEFCAATCEPSPHAILRTCLLRNFGAGDRHIHTEMKKLEYQKIELTMKVGKHTATVVCKNKKTAKQRASQAILQALHPHVRSWGSLLRLYGSRSVKSCKEKKLEEQQITLLQDAARHNEPNYAVLEKLRNEMRKLRERDEAVVPIGTLLVKDDLPTHSGSNLNNVDL